MLYNNLCFTLSHLYIRKPNELVFPISPTLFPFLLDFFLYSFNYFSFVTSVLPNYCFVIAITLLYTCNNVAHTFHKKCRGFCTTFLSSFYFVDSFTSFCRSLFIWPLLTFCFFSFIYFMTKKLFSFILYFLFFLLSIFIFSS